MWYLHSVADAALRFSLVPDKDMVVGRKDCDILITGDQSISRKHAIVHLNGASPGVVSLTDCKSKFGTTVNGKKLAASQKIELHHNDVISFGQRPATGPATAPSGFKLIHEPLVFCCSAMSKQESSKVKQLAKPLGAKVENSWSEHCSHLVMTEITVTVKVVAALSSCKPVITPAWVSEAARCLQASLPLPSTSSYQPEVVDTNIGSGENGAPASFAPIYNRTVLFQDHVFYFLAEKQYDRLKFCLLSAGASCRLASSPGCLPLETFVKEESVVLAVDNDVMNRATPTQKQWVSRVNTYLISRKLRAVHDSEIGFALLYISAKEYCNPRATLTLPIGCSPMAPPTLSQAQFSQPHSSHHHSLTHTLPYTQDPHLHTQDQATILAPDTVDQSQNTTAKTSSSGIQKINETITSVKSSLDKGSCDKGSLDKGSDSVKTEGVFPFNEAGTGGACPPSKVELVKDKTALISQCRGNPRSEGSGTSTTATKASITATKTATATNSSSSTTVTKITGLTTATKTASSMHPPVQTLSAVKKEPFDILFGGDMDDEPDDFQAPQVSNPVPNKSSPPTPSQTAPLPSPSQLEGSVIVPCSLTPPTQDKVKGHGKSSLPSSELLASAFQGKRKKRPLSTNSDEVSELVHKASKKQRVHDDREDGGGKIDSEAERMDVGVESGRNNGETEAAVRSTNSGLTGATSGGLFSGLKSKRMRTNTKEMTTVKSSSKTGGPYLMEGLPMLETCDDPKVQQKEQGDREEHQVKESHSGDISMDGQTSPLPCGQGSSDRPPSPSTARTPPPSRQKPPPSTFLSTRRKRTTPTVPPTPAHSTRPVSPLAFQTQLTTATQGGYPTITQRTGVCIATPFTTLVTGGKRSKATDRENTTLWDDDQMDGEDPLVDPTNEDPPKKVYKPVCDEDGFVCSRIKPKVQTSRIGRLAAFAGTESSQPHSQTSEHRSMNGSQDPALSQPVAEILYTRLVMSGRRGRGRGEGGGEGVDGGLQQISQNGVKNFKTFHKVQHIGLGAIPRLVSLKEYVPPTSRELQDWKEYENVSDAVAREQESSQDLFRFSTTRRQP